MSEYNIYPEKPELEVRKKKPGGIGMTIFSIILFISTMLLLFSDSIFFILILVVVLLFHELGHYSFMKLFKYKDVRMLFVPLMGAFVQGMKDRYSQVQSFLVVMAGPIPGLTLGIALFILAQSYQSASMMTISLLFIFLNGINLLPLDPMDGGQLLKLLIKKNQDIFQLFLSLTTSLLLIILGLYLDSIIMIAFGFLMAIRVRSLQRNYIIHKDLINDNIEYESTYDDLDNKQYAQIKEVVLRNTPALQKFMSLNSGEDIEPVIASQVRNILVAPLTRDASALQQALVILIWILSFALPLYLYSVSSFDWYINAIQNW
jgi:stage IV sporulation protein FB|tara:strand:- start:27283 stop:28236 length:954 start_codon:yes stop_codon:yes gene_type:complete